MLFWKVLQAEVAYIASYMPHRTRKGIHYGWNVFLATYEKPSVFETLMTIFIYCSWVFDPVAAVGNLVKNRKKAAIHIRDTIHKTIQMHRILHKIENKRTKQKTYFKRILKKRKSSN
jgi:hypothetical protein